MIASKFAPTDETQQPLARIVRRTEQVIKEASLVYAHFLLKSGRCDLLGKQNAAQVPHLLRCNLLS